MDNIAEIVGCLSHLKTPDSVARRRPGVPDEDLVIPGSSPFLVDFFYKILCSKALRRSGYKTQVITRPENNHVRSRRSHTDEVIAVAVRISEILGLNVALALAIAAGHDIGHTPFGHIGEIFLSNKVGKKISHETLGVIIAQSIERRGVGLNLTHQVLTGILYHDTARDDLTDKLGLFPEARVVSFSDQIAFLVGDVNDLFSRSGLSLDAFPKIKEIIFEFGENQRQRINRLVVDFCQESAAVGQVSFCQSETARLLNELKREMRPIYPKFNLYQAPEILDRIYDFLSQILAEVNTGMLLALMTDQDVLYLHGCQVLSISDLARTSVWEIVPYLRNRTFDLSDPDLDW